MYAEQRIARKRAKREMCGSASKYISRHALS